MIQRNTPEIISSQQLTIQTSLFSEVSLKATLKPLFQLIGTRIQIDILLLHKYPHHNVIYIVHSEIHIYSLEDPKNQNKMNVLAIIQIIPCNFHSEIH